jgi:hypothetical protein
MGTNAGDDALHSKKDDDLLAKKKEFWSAYFQKGAEFIEELLQENEKLRFRVVQVEEELASVVRSIPTPGTLRELIEKIHALELERAQLLERFGHVQAENRSYQRRYAEIEQENNTLANLYIAEQELRAAVSPQRVAQVSHEILRNFIGAKTFALYFIDRSAGVMRSLVSEGARVDELPTLPLDGAMASVIAEGRLHIASSAPEARGSRGARWDEPWAAVPIKSHDRAWGVILVWELLQQKDGLAPMDLELMKMLSAHLATRLDTAELDKEVGAHVLPFSILERVIRGS